MDGLDGDDEGVELLVTKHPEMKSIKIGCFYCVNITDRGLQTLLTADGLIKVWLSDVHLITGEILELHSNSAKHIQHLALQRCSLTTSGLLKILDICGIQLTSLDLKSCRNITGEGFHVLQDKFANMEKLTLASCVRLSQQGLLEILMMCGSKLQDLDISRTKITGHRIEELQGKLADLKTLNLQCNLSLTDQGLLKVLRMCGTKLQDLNISNTIINGQGLDELQGKFAYLETLNLRNCSRLTDQGLLSVLKMLKGKLQDLDISDTHITGIGLDKLHGKLADLETLNLGKCSRLTNQILLQVLRMCSTKLQDLNISGTNISGQGLDKLQGKLDNLKTLDLGNCYRLKAQGLLEVLRMCGSKLQDLNICGIDISGQGLEDLQGKFADLKTLDLGGSDSFIDQGLLKVLRMCGSKLQDLNISGTNITGQGLEELQGKFVDLRTLNLHYCYSLSDQGFSEIINISGPLIETVKFEGFFISREVKNRITLYRPNLTIEGDVYEYEYEDESENDNEDDYENQYYYIIVFIVYILLYYTINTFITDDNEKICFSKVFWL